jgi:ATPase subunit of ABC transporter with duplicated ATPase domains
MRLNGFPIEDEDLAQRIKIVREICIPHKRFAELDKLIHVSRLTGQGIAILGETGAGKSTLFKKYEAKYPRYIKRKVIKGHECDTTIIPILRVELDSNSSPLNVASKMLECIGDDRYFEGREKVLTSRLKGYIVDAEVELIIIDE